MDIRIAGTVNDSIVDGPGFRYTIFTQGCPHHCPGCHNPQTHDYNGGKVVDTAIILDEIADNPLLDGITLSGGEPFEQPEACGALCDGARKLGLNIWAYSGFTFEQLIKDERKKALLEKTDVLIDGPFILAQRTLEARFRGSKNQRLIDVRASLEKGEVVLLEG